MKLSEIKMATTPPFHPNCKCESIGGTVIPDLEVCDYCLEQINKLNLTGVGVEVGVQRGIFSAHLLKHWSF
jgi:hypothetical protein